MTQFQQSVIKVVNLVPEGKVVSYGQVALYVGLPRAAREVGWILKSLEEAVELPWWRVINNEGRISIKGNKYNDADTQRKLLQAEAIEVTDLYEVDIEKYRWIAKREELKNLKLDDDYIEKVLKKYSNQNKLF